MAMGIVGAWNERPRDGGYHWMVYKAICSRSGVYPNNEGPHVSFVYPTEDLYLLEPLLTGNRIGIGICGLIILLALFLSIADLVRALPMTKKILHGWEQYAKKSAFFYLY